MYDVLADGSVKALPVDTVKLTAERSVRGEKPVGLHEFLERYFSNVSDDRKKDAIEKINAIFQRTGRLFLPAGVDLEQALRVIESAYKELTFPEKMEFYKVLTASLDEKIKQRYRDFDENLFKIITDVAQKFSKEVADEIGRIHAEKAMKMMSLQAVKIGIAARYYRSKHLRVSNAINSLLLTMRIFHNLPEGYSRQGYFRTNFGTLVFTLRNVAKAKTGEYPEAEKLVELLPEHEDTEAFTDEFLNRIKDPVYLSEVSGSLVPFLEEFLQKEEEYVDMFTRGFMVSYLPVVKIEGDTTETDRVNPGFADTTLDFGTANLINQMNGDALAELEKTLRTIDTELETLIDQLSGKDRQVAISTKIIADALKQVIYTQLVLFQNHLVEHENLNRIKKAILDLRIQDMTNIQALTEIQADILTELRTAIKMQDFINYIDTAVQPEHRKEIKEAVYKKLEFANEYIQAQKDLIDADKERIKVLEEIIEAQEDTINIQQERIKTLERTVDLMERSYKEMEGWADYWSNVATR